MKYNNIKVLIYLIFLQQKKKNWHLKFFFFSVTGKSTASFIFNIGELNLFCFLPISYVTS